MKYSFALISACILSIGSSFGQTETISTCEREILISPRSCCSNYRIVPSGAEIDILQDNSSESLLDITDPELSSSGLTPSPNPTKGMISVVIPANKIGLTIRVLDMAGRMVGEPILIQSTTQELTIEGESGIYLIVVESEKEILTARVVLETN
jgi:Secretion system C-terminal sorting domain